MQALEKAQIVIQKLNSENGNLSKASGDLKA